MFPFFNLNGKIVPANQPYFFSSNRSLRYGDGLFEGIRLMDGEILFFEDHCSRLFDGMKALGITMPEYFSSAYFFKHIFDLLVSNQVNYDVLIRIQVYRAGEGLYEPTNDEPAFFIELLPVAADGFVWNEKGISAGIFSEWKKELNPAMNFKTSNSLVYVMASRWKREMKLEDAFILNTKGNICDATSSTIFMWKNGKIVTPALSEGAIRGVIRKQVIEFALGQKIEVEEKTISPDELTDADEIFLTNISKGIRWIESFSGKNLEGDFTRRLAIEFYEKLRKKN